MYKEFIEKANKKHNNRYDYSKVEYKNSKTKVIIICPKHGEFKQSPNSHLRGSGCLFCGKEKIRNSGTRFKQSFIKKANQKHSCKYEYSKVDYKNSVTPVIIICPEHGEFEQTPTDHLRYGCVSCSKDEFRNREKKKFIEKANKKHNNKYDYSKVEYVDTFTKVIIICPEHGEFEHAPHMHLKYGCKKCGYAQSGFAISYSKEEFIEKANKKHNNKYSYNKISYENLSSKLIIICPNHGEFEQKAKNHLKYGCPKCGIKSLSLGADGFKKKARKIHSSKYDYSAVEYVNSHTKVSIICPDHGEFKQTPSCHLNGRGCPRCAEHTTIDFIEKANKKHNNRYDYSKVEYKNKMTKVKIVCPIHGEFEQRPHSHINGKNCQQCAHESLSSNTEEFVKKSLSKHGNKYDYSKVDYINNRSKVIISCDTHGEFLQVPMDHLRGCGCPRCEIVVSSDHQDIVDFIKSHSNVELKINDRDVISPYELDIYVPKHNFAIEYHGLYWHSYDKNESIEERKKHQHKHQLCLDNNIKLLQIFENEWSNTVTNGILKSKIKLSLGICNKIYARKCKIKELNNEEYNNFIDTYHLQGHKSASVRLGLFYRDELVSVMSFNKHPKYEWEITRFASKLNTIIVGGASKLFKYFNKNYEPCKILTYADRRYSNGNLYKKLGFKLCGSTKPNYFYIKNNKIFSRQQFQKHKLKKKLEHFDQVLTESQNMFNNGYRRIWDAGHFKFLLVKDTKQINLTET